MTETSHVSTVAGGMEMTNRQIEVSLWDISDDRFEDLFAVIEAVVKTYRNDVSDSNVSWDWLDD